MYILKKQKTPHDSKMQPAEIWSLFHSLSVLPPLLLQISLARGVDVSAGIDPSFCFSLLNYCSKSALLCKGDDTLNK